MSTRSLTLGQSLKIIITGIGIYTSKVTGVSRDHVEIELPKGKQAPGGFSWKNRDVEVYFWKKDDAGYCFDSKVLNAPDKSMDPRLRMNHSDSLIRTQKRASVRQKLNQDAWIVPLRGSSEATEKYEENVGYRGKLIDISDSGLAILVRGVLESGFYLKVQTRLADLPVVVCGEIKSVNSNKEKGYSILHVEAIPLSRSMKIRILAFVLGITRLDSTQALAKQLKHEQNSRIEDSANTVEPAPIANEIDLAQANDMVTGLENLEEEHLSPPSKKSK